MKGRTFYFFLAIGFILRLYFSQYLEHRIDMTAWRGWGRGINTYGPLEFYAKMWCDYMPAYPLVLGFLYKIEQLLPAALTPILYKLPANCADLVISLMIFRQAKSKIASLSYFFNPAVIANSTLWGQVDAIQALMMSGSLLLAFYGRAAYASALTALSFMFKPQGIIIAPIIAYFSLKKWMVALLSFLSVCLLISLPYGGFFGFIWERYQAAYTQYPYSSIYAFNLWSIVQGYFKSDQVSFLGLTYQTWGAMLFLGSYLAIALAYIRQKGDWQRMMLAASLVMMALFFFATRAHERGFFAGLALFSFVFILYPRYWLFYVYFSAFHLFNMIFAYLKVNPIYGYKAEGLDMYATISTVFALFAFGWLSLLYFRDRE